MVNYHSQPNHSKLRATQTWQRLGEWMPWKPTSSHPHFVVLDKACKWGQIVVKVGPSPQLMRFPLWPHAPWLGLSVHHRTCKCKWISLSTPNYWIFVAGQHKLCGHHHFSNILLVVLISVLTLSLVIFCNEDDIQHHNFKYYHRIYSQYKIYLV